MIHDIHIDEGQRQMILLALAQLAQRRPGWDGALNEIALKMDNHVPVVIPGVREVMRARLYDEFRALDHPHDPAEPDFTLHEAIRNAARAELVREAIMHLANQPTMNLTSVTLLLSSIRDAHAHADRAAHLDLAPFSEIDESTTP